MSTPVRSILDAPERVRARARMAEAKWGALLDVGEGWVVKHIQIWRSYVEKPANKVHDNVERRTTRLDRTLKAARRAVPHPFGFLR